MKSILIPTDFSQSANNAAEFAFEIALILGLPVRFLHSIKTTVDWPKINRKDEVKYP